MKWEENRVPSDLFLVKKAKEGDKEAFVQLFKSYEAVLYNTARKFLNNSEDIADCLQETQKIKERNFLCRIRGRKKYNDTFNGIKTHATKIRFEISNSVGALLL
ncbi:RNA polymerase sigma factor [Enterococcus hirae]